MECAAAEGAVAELSESRAAVECAAAEGAVAELSKSRAGAELSYSRVCAAAELSYFRVSCAGSWPPRARGSTIQQRRARRSRDELAAISRS